MVNYIDEKRIQDLSDGDSSVPLYQKILKMSEESGELSQAFLKYDGSLNTSASANGKAEHVIEEACDCINVAMDIVNAMTKNNPDLEAYTRELFQAKLTKWESKQEQYLKPAVDEGDIPIDVEPSKSNVITKFINLFRF